MPVRTTLIGLLFVFLLNGCGSIAYRMHPSPEIAPDAEARIQFMKQMNPDLASLKGIGDIRLITPEGDLRARMAWAAARPSRLRIQVLGFTGQPLQSFAFNGRRVYIVSHTDRHFYTRRQRNPSLVRMIGIDIHAHDIVKLLCGRAPMIPFRSVGLETREDGTATLILSGRRLIQHIHFGPAGDRIIKHEVFDRNEQLVYRASIDRFQRVEGHLLPMRITLVNADHDGLSLDVDRCWPNSAADEDLFVLTRPSRP